MYFRALFWALSITPLTGSIAAPHGTQSNNTGFVPEVEWVWSTLRGSYGNAILATGDILGDQADEIVFSIESSVTIGESASSVFVVHSDLGTAACRFLNVEGTIFDTALQQYDGDPQLEILIATDARVYLIDGSTCRLQDLVQLPQTVMSAVFGDFDGDDSFEIAYSDGTDVYVSGWEDFANPVERRGVGGSMLATGNLDTQAGEDIVSVADVIYVMNGSDLTTITEIPNNYWDFVDTGQINGDAFDEIIVWETWDVGIRAYSVVDNSEVLDFPVFNFEQLETSDVNGDGVEEIIYGDRQFGSVHVINGEGERILEIPKPNPGISSVAAADLNGSGPQEILWTSGGLYVGDLDAEEIIWQSYRGYGPHQIAAAGPRLAALSYVGSGDFRPGGAYLLNRKEGMVESEITAIDDLPNDSRAWTAAGSNRPDNPNDGLYCFAGAEFIQCHESQTQSVSMQRAIDAESVHHLSILDLDNDDSEEVLTADSLGVLRAYDAASGILEWQSNPPETGNSSIDWGFESIGLVGNELWLVEPFGELRKYDPNTGDLISRTTDTGLTRITVADGTVFGSRAGEGVGTIDPLTLNLSETLFETTAEVASLRASPDGRLLLVATGTRPVLDFVLVSTHNVFSPVSLGSHTSWDEAILGTNEILLATDNGALRMSASALDWIHRDRFEPQ
jgi:hypothetical protein